MAEKKISFYMTCGISAAMDESGSFSLEIADCIHRFTVDDWGDLCEDDKALNRQAKACGGRILAAYPSARGRVYIITDDATANEQITTVLFADEY